jgi:DNA-binding NarL/FixJ family response regulator
MKATKMPASAPVRKRILLVDDHPITRDGLTQLINHEPDLIVCGEFDNASQAFTAIESRKPDLVLTDITMPGKSGLELIKDIQALKQGTPVLVMSMHDETIFAERVLRAGGHGYIMKSEGGEKLLQAIRHVLQGDIYVSEKITGKFLGSLAAGSMEGNRAEIECLSDREFEVFRSVGQGLTTGEISERLHISPKTVDTHRAHIKDKLQLRTMPELSKYAIRWAAAQNLI